MYFITTLKSGTAIRGQLPLLAAEVLAWLSRTSDPLVEIRDDHDQPVPLDLLRQEAAPHP